jgi:amino acid adenylation domain-containing protein/non-ribosomal peptide synthase protein (TIGR01720 family)
MLNQATRESAVIPVSDEVLPALFERGVRDFRDVPAVVFDGAEVSYAELNARACRLAALLRARGAGVESRVAVAIPRSVELVVALYAVHKAGGAYVPIDPDHPEDRIAFMLGDCGARVVLTTRAVAAGLPPVPGVEVVELDADPVRAELACGPDDFPAAGLRPGNAAYVIYTSGSTGRPKGVVIQHDGIVNRLRWMQDRYRLRPGERVLQKTPAGFDVSVWEFFWPLLAGATLVVAKPGGHRDPVYLAGLIRAQRVTTAHFVPSMLEVFLDQPGAAECGSLRRVVCSGEALPPRTRARFFEVFGGSGATGSGATLHNLYGPTEASVDVTSWECSTSDTGETVPIGRPVWNTGAHVLDDRLRPVAPGVTGELYLTGVQLARGYGSRPGLTAERFAAAPFGRGTRMYRTGDLARRRPDGVLEYLGRADSQLKIRGQRIEPGEVEAVLGSVPGVRRAAVLAGRDGQGLVAYLVAEPGLDPAAVRAHTAKFLPEPMVPSAVVVLDEFPVTANGKLDRAALLRLEAVPATASRQLPRNDGEERLCRLFGEVLGVTEVGIDDSFFDLGGHSLLGARLIGRIRTEFGVELPIQTLFDAPAARELSGELAKAAHARRALAPAARPETVPLSPAQRRLWFLWQLEGPVATYNIPLVLRLSGPLDEEALRAAVDDVVARHESLRTVFPEQDGEPRQLVRADPAEWPSLSTVEVAEPGLAAWIRAEAGRGFELTGEPPLRATLLRTGPERHVLVLVVHHIAGDAWSMAPFAADLSRAYAARAGGRAPELAPLPVQYADYTLWQRDLLANEDDPDSVAGQQLAYWRTALAGLPDELPLPVDRPRPALAGHTGGTVRLAIPAEAHARLAQLARQCRSSLFMVLHATLAVLLGRSGGGTDIPLGTSIAGRTDDALAELVGCFVNTLVLRADLSGDPSFRDLVRRLRRADLAALAHQDIPFERLVDLLRPERSLARHPLFQVMFTFQNAPAATLELPGLTASVEESGTATAKFDLNFELRERFDGSGGQAGIDVAIEYSRDLFDEGTVTGLGAELVRLLGEFADDPDRSLGELTAAPVATRPAGAPAPEPGPGANARQEEQLRLLFADILGLAGVEATDDFFDLGGDSIMSIRLVSRARRAGLALGPRDVFVHKTVRRLAAAAAKAGAAASVPGTGDPVGIVTATPAVCRLLERGGPADGAGLPVLLRVPPALGPAALTGAPQAVLTGAVQAVLDHHDGLRARLVGAGGRELEIRPPGAVSAAECVTRVDVSGLPDEGRPGAVAEHAEAARRWLSPGAGRMVRVVWFDAGDRPGDLLVVPHELVADRASLRILLPDLAAALATRSRGETPRLDPVGTSFRYWAALARADAVTPARRAELPHWQAVTGRPAPLLPGAAVADPARDTPAVAGSLTVSLPTHQTSALRTLASASNAGLDEVLLTGLTLAAARWRREPGRPPDTALLVELEAHGREPIAAGIDLSRTVGRFAAAFPVRLDPGALDLDDAFDGGPAAGTAFKRVKEQLRAVPGHGLGYGLLRYLDPEAALTPSGRTGPDVGFSYLGQLDSAGLGDWTVADAVPPAPGPASPLAPAVEIEAWQHDGADGPVLTTRWSWAGALLTASSARSLADTWTAAAAALAEYAGGPAAGGHTPSDLPLVRLSQHEIDEFEDEWEDRT